jgi:hypothetical protein
MCFPKMFGKYLIAVQNVQLLLFAFALLKLSGGASSPHNTHGTNSHTVFEGVKNHRSGLIGKYTTNTFA